MEIHDGRKCFDGQVYVEPYDARIYGRSQISEADYALGQRLVRPCLICSLQRWTKRFGQRLMSWDNWRIVPGLEESLARFTDWAPGGENRAVLLHAAFDGECGNGKTHALSATGVSYLKRGRRVKYWNCGDLAENLRDPYFPEIAEYTGLALFDDLGSEASFPGNRDALDRLLDARYRAHRPTVVTSHLSRATLREKYPRFLRRVEGAGLPLEWSAASYRQGGQREIETAPPSSARPAPAAEQESFEEYARRLREKDVA